MPVPTNLSDLSATPASNYPASTDTLSTTDDYLRAIEAILAKISAGSNALVTPALGTPASGNLTNCTGVAVAVGGITGLGTGVATALAVNVGSAGAPVVLNGALGTPSSGTVTNLTGTASININGTVGATTPGTGAFTTVTASGAITAHTTIKIWRGAAGTASNIAIGEGTMPSEVSGIENVTIGYQSMNGLTTGDYNSVFGYKGAFSTTDGAYNAAYGYQALYSNVSGGDNVAIGANALYENTGSTNTAIGSAAGYFSAGNGHTSGSNNSFIGANAAGSTRTASNEFTLGDGSIAVLRCQVTSITALSDARDKSDVRPLSTGLDTVMALNPVRFTWATRDGSKAGVKDSGFIAQELQSVDDDWLKLVYAENPERLEASYGRLIPVLVKAIQELKTEVDSLRAQLLG